MRARPSPASVSMVCSVVLAVLAVPGAFPAPAHAQGSATTPAVPVDGWMQYATPEEAGWSPDRIADEEIVFVHRAHPLNGGVRGQLVHEELFRLMDARTGPGDPDPELVPFDPGE